MPDTAALSNIAIDLLRRLAAGEDIPASDANRPAYDELVEAGVMIRAHSFTGGWYYAPNKAGWKLLEVLKRAC